MSWKNFLRSASFRGIPFEVVDSEAAAGRKTATHEFPGKDKNYIEDLGKQTRLFNVEAFIIGDLYKFRKDQLIKACETPGPGRLVHPYFGSLKVQVIGLVRIRETQDEGGMARITIQFSESKKPAFPSTLLDTVGNLLGKALSAFSRIEAGFTDTFNLFQQPAAIVNGVIDSMDAAVAAIEDGYTVARTVAGFTETLDRIKSNIKSGELAAQAIAQDFIELFSYNKSESGIEENLSLQNFNKDTGTIEANKKAFDKLIQYASVVAAAQAATGIDFESTTQADRIQSVVVVALDQLMESVSDDIYYQIHDLRASFIEDITARSINTPRLIEITNQIALPSLYMAYDLYEDIERADDIVNRNSVEHPGFVPGSVPLEVLSRE